MVDFLYYAVAFIVALGILIVVHEFGHFWVARRLGVKVLRFSVGFGKPLWLRRVGKDRMELVVSALPLGGYVKMLDETEGRVPKNELHRAFNRQPVWKRMAIVTAGPLFNFLFAVLAYSLVFMVGVDGIKPIVGGVTKGSIAYQAGFRAGDQILRIDDKHVQSWDHRRLYLFRRALDRARVTFDVRDSRGQNRTRILDLTDFPVANVNAALLERGLGLYGYIPEVLPIIGRLEPGPAERAGLRVGDRFITIDGQPVSTWQAMSSLVRDSPGRALRVTVKRNGVFKEFDVTPDAVEQDGQRIGRISIRPKFPELPDTLRVKVRFGAMQALVEGTTNTWSMAVLTLEMLYRMLRLEVSTKNISGPITIARYAGYSAKIGVIQFVVFLAIISISLGVLNLLPIPILDGGHLLYYVIEVIKGSPVSERVMAAGQQIGVAILVGLMLLAFYNDLSRLFQ